MSISDFIVVLSIIVTLITVSVSNNKYLWLYKFDCKISILLIIIVILIHYLIFFDSYFYYSGWYFKCFVCSNGLKANIWAYIITIITLIFLVYYIVKYHYFPKSNNHKIIRYYESLINTDIVRLMNNIDNYHKKDIDRYFELVNKLSKENSKKDLTYYILFEGQEQENRKAEPNLARDIVHSVLFNKNFIKHSLEIEPVYFLDKVYKLTVNIQEPINFYFTCLIESKNTEFISELEDILNHNNLDTQDVINNDKRFLPLIFKEKQNFVFTFTLDKVFGEVAYKEVCIGNYIFNQKTSEWLEEDYRKTSCYQFLQFFMCLHLFLIDADIPRKKKYKTLYLEYIHLITNKIVELYPINADNTYVKKFIDDCITNLKYLLERCFQKERYDYLYIYLQELLNVTKEHTDYCKYNKDSLENVINTCLSLGDKYNESECYKESINYIKSQINKIDVVIVKDILENIDEIYRTKAYNQIKKIFKIDEE